jgi:hypothetical protein
VLDNRYIQHMTGDSRMFNSINEMITMGLIVALLVTMAKARSRGLVRL